MLKKKVELMAPAGNFESMTAAIQGGADAVYFGIEQLNMRARATMNFTLDDLEAVADLCSQHNVKSYITLNTILYNHDLSLMKRIVNEAIKYNISAVIASDQAVINYASGKGMPVHISTQVNISNIETVKFYAHFADVMVLARELSMVQMKEITQAIEREQIKGPSGNLVRIEVFAHGALCMAISGKCYLSLHSHNSSANRGVCIQNCRRQYEVKDRDEGVEFHIENEYIMSPKDLNTLPFLDQLLDTGIDVLKIEGRARAPEYVKTVTHAYKQAILAVQDGSFSKEKTDAWQAEVEKVYNRGFWGGYYLGKKMGEWSDGYGSKATTKKIYIGRGVHYFPKINVGEFKIESHTLKKGDQLLVTGPTTGVLEFTADEIWVNNGAVDSAAKGVSCSIKVPEKIRASDKLYKIVDS
ncbi:MAG TPA: U32 family peptidase [Bacteroidetes bacterium]|nr:U32 family peptidase [Bacteroidota bacterium]